MSEELLLKKIRSEFIPRNLQPLFFSVGVGMDVILERLLEMECFEKKMVDSLQMIKLRKIINLNLMERMLKNQKVI